jgi:hypothetical protein
MSKRISILASAALLLLSPLVGISSASAAEPTLTYEEWSSSDNFIEMSDAMSAFGSKISGGKGVDFHLKLTSTVGSATTSNSEIHFVTAAKQNAYLFKYAVSGSQGGGNVNYNLDFGLSKGTYFGTIGTLKTMTQAKPAAMTAALKKIGASKAKYFKSTKANSTTNYMKMIQQSYTQQLSGSNLSNWNIVGANVDAPNTFFSEVEKAPNAKNPADTDYSWDFKSPSSLSSEDLSTYHTKVTISADGNHTSVTTEGDSPYFSAGTAHIMAATVFTYNPNLVVTTPNLATAVNLEKLLGAIYMSQIVDALKTIATNIVAQAKTASTKAHKSISASFLAQAAKTQASYSSYLKYSKIPNGIKLKGTYQGVSAFMCVKVVGKSTQIKTC